MERDERSEFMNGYAVSLTKQEHAIMCLIAAGYTNRQAALRLHISHHTVAQHVTQMLHRFGARSRCELVARAYVQGILSPAEWPPGECPRTSQTLPSNDLAWDPSSRQPTT